MILVARVVVIVAFVVIIVDVQMPADVVAKDNTLNSKFNQLARMDRVCNIYLESFRCRPHPLTATTLH